MRFVEFTIVSRMLDFSLVFDRWLFRQTHREMQSTRDGKFVQVGGIVLFACMCDILVTNSSAVPLSPLSLPLYSLIHPIPGCAQIKQKFHITKQQQQTNHSKWKEACKKIQHYTFAYENGRVGSDRIGSDRILLCVCVDAIIIANSKIEKDVI